MTLEEMQKEMQRLNDEKQEAVARDILERISNLYSKTFDANYPFTKKEADMIYKALELLSCISNRTLIYYEKTKK